MIQVIKGEDRRVKLSMVEFEDKVIDSEDLVEVCCD